MTKNNFSVKPKTMKQGFSEPSVTELAVLLNFSPNRPALFEQALVHSSYAHEKNIPSNERLEFLGDSILSLIVCNYLFQEYPTKSEGELALLKSSVVSMTALAAWTRGLGLERFVRLGQGERRSQGSTKPNIQADLFEAFIGAYFLNFGLEETTRFVLPLIKESLPEIIAQSEAINAKTNFQELAQSRGLKPFYRTVREEGPPHQKVFTVEVMIDDQVFGVGVGRSLKEAQNYAAHQGLAKMRDLY